jgi:transposase
MNHDILLTVDYHDEKSVIRRLDRRTGSEQLLTVPTDPQRFAEVIAHAQAPLGRRRGGQVVWIQESTTGWARVQALLAEQPRVVFVLANVVQMPLPPKARRRKTDKIDTARIQREYLNGALPKAHQPSAWLRQVRRQVAMRENLVRRQTALRNWINRYLAHETWASRANLWSAKGQQRLRGLLTTLPASDRQIIQWKLDELTLLRQQRVAVEAALYQLQQNWPEAQRIDAIKGISVAAAVSIAARIGPVERFADAEQLIAYAGLAPGVQQSDQTRRNGRIGGGGTDKQLRHYLIEASIWARQLPRYEKTYERTAARRGKKIGRLVVARMMLRSIYKMLRDGVAFEAAAVARTSG